MIYFKTLVMKSFIKFTAGFGCALIVLFSCLLLCCFSLFAVAASFTKTSGLDAEEKTISKVIDSKSTALPDKVAVINISEEIVYSVPETTATQSATSNNIIEQLKRAQEDAQVKAVIVRFNTPGGEVSAAEPICRAMKSLNATKPVYGFIDSMGASLGYLLANCTRYIYARDAAIVGSIGVIIKAVDIDGILVNFGGKVEYITNTEGDNKSGQGIFDKNSETYKIYQGLLDESYDYFLTKIVDGRNGMLTKASLKPYADGRIFSAKQALALKLIDEIGEFDEVLSSVMTKENINTSNYTIFEYKLPVQFPDFSSLLFGKSELELIKKNASSTEVLMILPSQVTK